MELIKLNDPQKTLISTVGGTILLGGILFGTIYLLLDHYTYGGKETLTILIIAGAFGGLLFSIIDREKKFELSYYDNEEKKICLGSLADMLIGSGAAVSIYFVLSGTLKFEDINDGKKNVDNALKIIGIAIVSGLAGKAVLSGLKNKLLKQIESVEEDIKKDRTKAQINLYNSIGEVHRLGKRWESAKWAFRETISLDNRNIPAKLGLAKTYLDEGQKEASNYALNLCNEAISINDKFAPAYLIRAKVKKYMGIAFDDDKKKAEDIDKDIIKFYHEEGLES